MQGQITALEVEEVGHHSEVRVQPNQKALEQLLVVQTLGLVAQVPLLSVDLQTLQQLQVLEINPDRLQLAQWASLVLVHQVSVVVIQV